jgi:3-keto-L-gulonate-6-phosphate decarboxylase
MTHRLTAQWIEGRGLVVIDENGAEVKVSFGATSDCCTCYAYTQDGFIGGWQCAPKSRRMTFRNLVDAINARNLYAHMNDLLSGRRHARFHRQYDQATI